MTWNNAQSRVISFGITVRTIVNGRLPGMMKDRRPQGGMLALGGVALQLLERLQLGHRQACSAQPSAIYWHRQRWRRAVLVQRARRYLSRFKMGSVGFM